MQRYKSFLKLSKERFSDNSYGKIKDALRVAIEHLGTMKRYDDTPFIYHAIGVAEIVIKDIGLGRNSVISCLLHDVARLGHLSIDQIGKSFGSECAEVLLGLNNISAVPSKASRNQTDHFKELIVSYSTNPRIILIKLADRLEVMRSLGSFPVDKRAKKSWESLHLYSQLAHKLGLYGIKTEMEDLSLRHLEPESYKEITEKLEVTKSKREDFIEQFILPIKGQLDKLAIECSIKGRTKSVYSIWRKMNKQNSAFEQVYDVFAIRIIVTATPETEKSLCWNCYSVVTDFYKPNPERMRDWISIPKSNGYESLHTTVVTSDGKWVEVQIRTERMDEVAERGIAAHWKYKGVSGGKTTSEDWLSRLREMMDNVEIEGGTLNLDTGIVAGNSEIFVFTPSGDLRKLPTGATLLDFAFDIHSDLGTKCIGGKINHKNVTIKEVLKNGDLVEIATSKSQKPKADWLNIAITSKARTRIKVFLREEQSKLSLLGREELERKLRNWKLNISLEESVNVLYKYYKAKSGLDFYGMIVSEKVSMTEVKEILNRHLSGDNILRITESRTDKVKESNRASDDCLIIDDTLRNVSYKFAKCCNPISGDDIFAFVTVLSGITIHRSDCVNAVSLVERYPYRIIKATWSEGRGGGKFSARIDIICENALGIEHSIKEVMKELHVNLRAIDIDSISGNAKGVVTVEVSSASVLNSVLYRLSKIKGITKAVRHV